MTVLLVQTTMRSTVYSFEMFRRRSKPKLTDWTLSLIRPEQIKYDSTLDRSLKKVTVVKVERGGACYILRFAWNVKDACCSIAHGLQHLKPATDGIEEGAFGYLIQLTGLKVWKYRSGLIFEEEKETSRNPMLLILRKLRVLLEYAFVDDVQHLALDPKLPDKVVVAVALE